MERGPRGHGDLAPLEEERAVIQRLQAGDRAAIGVLYGWYGDTLYRQAILPRLPDRALAEDCLRDTFRTAIEKIASFQLVDRSIFFWLRRIAIHRAMDVHRLRAREAPLEAAGPEPRGETATPDRPGRQRELEDARRAVEAALTRIHERYATALRLRLLEDRTREDCASVLGVNVGTFDVLLHRACAAFRKVYAS